MPSRRPAVRSTGHFSQRVSVVAMTRSAPRALAWSVALGLFTLACYSALWFFTAQSLLHIAESWLDARRQEGLNIAYGSPTLAGFPRRIAITFPDVVVSGAVTKDRGQSWSWHTASIGVFAQPLVFGRVSVDLAGIHTLTYMGATEASLRIAAKQAAALVYLNGAGALTEAQLEITGLSASGRSQVEPWFTLEHAVADMTVNLPPTTSPSPWSRISLTADNLTLPDAIPAPLSRTMHKAMIVVDIAGEVRRMPLSDALEAWRVSGGALEMRDFALDWPPLSASGAGTFALDPALQPIGAVTSKLRGVPVLIDLLIASGRMPKAEASVVRGILGLMTKTPPDGGAPELPLALTLQDQKVYAGPLILMEMPEMLWSRSAAAP